MASHPSSSFAPRDKPAKGSAACANPGAELLCPWSRGRVGSNPKNDIGELFFALVGEIVLRFAASGSQRIPDESVRSRLSRIASDVESAHEQKDESQHVRWYWCAGCAWRKPNGPQARDFEVDDVEWWGVKTAESQAAFSTSASQA